MSAKPSCVQTAKPAEVAVRPVQAATDPLPLVLEQSATDVSMKEETELCLAFSEALLAVQDVDEEDANQPQLCSEYVKDIYKYLHNLEVISSPTFRHSCCHL